MHIYASIPTTPVWGVYLHRHTSMNYKLYARLSPSTSMNYKLDARLSPSTSLDHQHLRVMLQTNEHKVASDQPSDPATRPPVHCRVLVYVPSRFPALPAAPEHTSGLLPAGRPASLSPGETGWSAEMLQGCWCILSMFAVKRLPGLWFRLWGEFRLWILEFSVQ